MLEFGHFFSFRRRTSFVPVVRDVGEFVTAVLSSPRPLNLEIGRCDAHSPYSLQGFLLEIPGSLQTCALHLDPRVRSHRCDDLTHRLAKALRRKRASGVFSRSSGLYLVDGIDSGLEDPFPNHARQLDLDGLAGKSKRPIHTLQSDTRERYQILDNTLAADLGVDGRDVLLQVDVEEVIGAVRLENC